MDCVMVNFLRSCRANMGVALLFYSRLIVAFSVISLNLGCVSFGDGSAEVVERSKEEAPAWVGTNGLDASTSNDLLTYVSMRSFARDLPVGIKETQLLALAASAAAIQKKLSRDVAQLAESAGIQIESADLAHRLIKDVVHDSHTHYARVTDIYYEKLVDPKNNELGQYYKIFVRIDYLKSRYDEAMKQLAEKFRRSKRSDLQSLSGKMAPVSPNPLLGH